METTESIDQQAAELRDLYVRLTNSKDVAATFLPWDQIPQLVRDAWVEVLKKARGFATSEQGGPEEERG